MDAFTTSLRFAGVLLKDLRPVRCDECWCFASVNEPADGILVFD